MAIKPRSARSAIKRVQLDTGTEGGAKQSFKDEADINTIMGRYLKTGQISHLNPREAVFMDVSELGDYRGLLERGRALQDLFDGLPSDVRDSFDHDVMAFAEFAANPENADELEQLGLFPPSDSESDPQDPAPEGGDQEEGWSRDQPRDEDGRFSPGSGEQPET